MVFTKYDLLHKMAKMVSHSKSQTWHTPTRDARDEYNCQKNTLETWGHVDMIWDIFGTLLGYFEDTLGTFLDILSTFFRHFEDSVMNL